MKFNPTSADITKEFNDFIKTVPDGSTIEMPQGEFNMDGIALFAKRNNITIEGAGCTIKAVTNGHEAPKPGVSEIEWLWPRKRSQLVFKGCKGITIKNLTVYGSNPHKGINEEDYDSNLEAQTAFEFEGCDGVTLDSCKAYGTWGDFVYLGRWSADPSEAWTQNVVIKNCHFEDNGRQGISLVGASNVLIENNYLGNTRRATIDIEPDDTRTGSHNIKILNNTFGPGRLLAIASGGQPGIVRDVLIEGNIGKERYLNMTFEGPAGHTGYLKENIVIRNNVSDPSQVFNSPIGLMTFANAKNITITGNKASVSNTTAGVLLRPYVCGYNVTGNSFGQSPAEVFAYPEHVFKVCEGEPVPVPPPTPVPEPVIILSLKEIIITSPTAQPYKITTSTGATTLKTGSLQAGENKIALDFKRYKTLRVYVGTKYYTVTKP